jgi:hypothetical protein
VTNGPRVRALRPTLSPVILPNAQRRFVPRGQQSGSELDRISPITLQTGFYDRSYPSLTAVCLQTTPADKTVFTKSVTSLCSICERRSDYRRQHVNTIFDACSSNKDLRTVLHSSSCIASCYRSRREYLNFASNDNASRFSQWCW